MPTFAEMLETSETLEEKLASANTAERNTLQQKKAYVDFTAFGLFKKAMADFLPALKSGLGWGVGLGVPLVGGGLLLEQKAKSHADDLWKNVRNQALIAALGGQAAQALGHGLGTAFDPTKQERMLTELLPGGDERKSYEVTKVSADETADLRKLAAILLLDDVLIDQYGKLPPHEKEAAEACLFLNREAGTRLLRKLL